MIIFVDSSAIWVNSCLGSRLRKLQNALTLCKIQSTLTNDRLGGQRTFLIAELAIKAERAPKFKEVSLNSKYRAKNRLMDDFAENGMALSVFN